jgi:hypothetical protein
MARGASAIDCGDESRSGGMAMAKEPESQVDQRMAALLPELLLVLRRRRLAVAALVAAAPACWLAWPFTVADDAVPATPVAAPAWTIVRDDELQGLLGDAARPAGLVLAGERVFVAVAAVDPWPGESP